MVDPDTIVLVVYIVVWVLAVLAVYLWATTEIRFINGDKDG